MRRQPKINDMVAIKIKTNGNGKYMKAPLVFMRIIAVYSRTKVKVESGDVWWIKPTRERGALYEARG